MNVFNGSARTWAGILMAAVGALGSLHAQAQAYPTKPIKMVLPYTPGGPVDFVARVMEPKFRDGLGQPVVIEYKPGAGTAIGAAAVARSEPDGYTIMLGTISSHSMIQAYDPKAVPFDPVRDFTAIASIWKIPAAVLVNNALPARSIAELIALAKARPGKLAFGSAGVGNSTHFMGESFKLAAGIDMLHVPYKGQAGITAAVMAGDLQVMFETAQSQESKDGRVRALAVTSAKRSPFSPELPAVSETLPGFEFNLWFGFFGPANMPRPIVERLNAEVNRIIGLKDVQERFASQRAVPFVSSPQEFTRFVAAEYAKWTKVAKETGIRAAE